VQIKVTISLIVLFSIFSVFKYLIRKYHVHLFYPCFIFKHRIGDVTNYIKHGIFNVTLQYSGASFTINFDEKPSRFEGF